MGLWETVAGIPAGVATALLDTLKGILIAFLQPLLDAVHVLLTSNINPYDFIGFWQLIVSIISMFYLLLFIFVGLKFLLGSYDAVQRKNAKDWFKNTVVLVIAVNASLLLYSLFLDVSSAVAMTLWDSELDALFSLEDLSILNFIWILLFAAGAFAACVSLFIRALFLILGVMLAPVAVTLYLIQPLKFYGSFLLNFLGLTVFIQVIDIVILIALKLVIEQFAALEVMTMLGAAIGLFLIAFVNGLVFIFALLKALSTAKNAVPGGSIVTRYVTRGLVS